MQNPIPYHPLTKDAEDKLLVIMVRANRRLAHFCSKVNKVIEKRIRQKHKGKKLSMVAQKRVNGEIARKQFSRQQFVCEVFNRWKARREVVIKGVRIVKSEMAIINAGRACERTMLEAYSAALWSQAKPWQASVMSMGDLHNETVIAFHRAFYTHTASKLRFSTHLFTVVRRHLISVVSTRGNGLVHRPDNGRVRGLLADFEAKQVELGNVCIDGVIAAMRLSPADDAMLRSLLAADVLVPNSEGDTNGYDYTAHRRSVMQKVDMGLEPDEKDAMTRLLQYVGTLPQEEQDVVRAVMRGDPLAPVASRHGRSRPWPRLVLNRLKPVLEGLIAGSKAEGLHKQEAAA